MSTHDTTRFRQRRRAQDIPGRESPSPPSPSESGVGLQCAEPLPWPRNRSGEPSTIAELLAEPRTPGGAGRGKRICNACFLYCGAAGRGSQLKGEWRAGRPRFEVALVRRPAKIYRAGEIFFEEPGAHHWVSERQQC